MKKMQWVLPLALLGVLAASQHSYAAQQPSPRPAPAGTGSQTSKPARTASEQTRARHTATVEFVSADMKAHTLTYKDANGKTMTTPLRAGAEKEAAALKAGDRVMLTFQDNAKGEHQAITAVQRATAPSKPRY